MATATVNYLSSRRVLSVVYRVSEVHTRRTEKSDPCPSGLGLWTTEAEALDAARAYFDAEVARFRGEVIPSEAACIFVDADTLTYGWRLPDGEMLWTRAFVAEDIVRPIVTA